jgi:5-methylcytosine-specific restriction endonuclease McrA
MDFGKEMEQLVWEKGKAVPGYDPQNRRKDECGAWIQRDKHGIRDGGEFNWEIDHIIPKSHGGGDEPSNLRPLHWKNNASRQDGPLRCVVRAFGSRNVDASTNY